MSHGFSTRFSALLLLTLLCAFPVKAQTDDEISIETNIVVLNLSVTDKNGRFVRGLKQTDFIIKEDAVPQTETASFAVEDTPFAAMILIDFSGSMDGRMALARAAAIRFLDGLRLDDRAAVYRFDSEIVQMQDFSTGRDLAPVAYARQADGYTVLYDAIVEAAKKLSTRPEKRRAILVISDGADTRSRASADKAIDAALAADATVYAVDMADANQRVKGGSAAGVLKNLATKTGGRFVSTPDGREMRETFAAVVEELTNQYTITYRPTNQAKDGKWRTIEVTTAKPDLTIRTRRGYKAKTR